MNYRFILYFFCAMLTTSVTTYGQGAYTLSGKVQDVSNEPLIGITIQIDGTLKGTSTDINGDFSIQVNKGDVLVVSMVSMEQQRIAVEDQTFLQIIMIESSEILDEVVINGFQTVDRKLFTGASDHVKMEDIKAKGLADVGRMLEGQVAGVNVDNVSGTFGTSPKIRIRGNASINGNNQPLFVVDGVILEDLANVNTDDFISGNASTLISSSIASLNPDDIESFQILKDASATAIYGARAANGVVVITTKRGRSGELKVNYTGNFSVKLRPTYSQFNLLNSAEEMSVYRELYDKGIIDISTSAQSPNYGAMGKMFDLIASHDLEWGEGGTLNERFLNQYENANTDWFDVLFRDYALQQQHSLGFTTGNEKSNNYYSISWLNDQGQTIADNVQRFTASARNTYFISDKFTFGLKLSASYRDQTVPGTRNRELDPLTGRYSRSFDINPFSYSLNTSRSIRPYEENGDLEYFRRNYAPFNIIKELEYNYIDINVTDLSIQTDFEVTTFDNIVVKGVVQGRYASTMREHIVHENSNQAEAYRANGTQFIQQGNNLLFNDPNNSGLNPTVVLPQGGFNYLDQTNLINLFNRLSVQWNKTFRQNHEVNILAGEELRFTNRKITSTTGLGVVYESGGIVVTDPNIIEFFNLQNIDYYNLEEERDRFIGLFLNGGYSFRSKYIANFTVRYDGSNQLGESKSARFLPTWNVSGAWNAHNERFMKRFNFLDELKIRATYGVSGNLPPQASALLNLQAEVTVRPTDVEPYLYIHDLTNEDLTWEKLKEFNIGIDLGMFDNRVFTSFNYYRRNAFDLIGIVQTSGIGGQGLKVGNFADMEANGFEVTINTLNYNRGGIKWNTNFNFGYTKDKITRLDFGPRIVDAIGQGGAAVVDGPRRGLYSTKFAGLNGQGIPTFYDKDGEIVYQFDLQEREGLEETVTFEGATEPLGAGGITNSVSYKGVTFSFLVSGKFDYKIRLNDGFYGSYNDFQSLPGELVDRWVVPGDEEQTDIPVILDAGVSQSNGNVVTAYALYNKSNSRIANGDYVRLKNVRLSYSFTPQLVSKIGLSSASMSVEGQNIWLIYSDKALKGQDPEFFSTGGVALPQPKSITVSLNIGF